MRIIIIDDDDIVVMSLKMIAEASGIEVVATGTSGEEAIELYKLHKPDILLSDIRMDGMGGTAAAAKILKEFPDAKILFLTTFSDDEYVTDALKYGVKGYILKQDFEGIVPAIEAVYKGQSVFGGDIIGKLPDMTKEHSSDDDKFWNKGITEKEFEIIKLVADGLSNKEIASRLYLGEGTVRNYFSSILDKLELRDRTQLVVYYYKN
ncbi:MAG: response regulator transcription factor [Butyrivibrio crossotus]|nr:response regulator transcription factor [Butyrivibrio crossotus]MDY4028062.1 response regulator transcription factor [Butyrivibrio crossotus]